ncbi:murein biosynthesis integral membrane protein MurJ [Nocardioidaceae bacterium]|nr:murein biosynthesis integral membrane protein MurJ [Nocardioidaceae bacterium]
MSDTRPGSDEAADQATAEPVPDETTGEAAQSSVLSSSAVMAAGTFFSRISGFLRAGLLAAALGITTVQADVFTIANTIPNMLYILLAGGVFNAVLVPQLVRAMKAGEAEGEAYTSRVISAAVVFLAAVTVLLVVGAPLLMRLILDGDYFSDPALAGARDSAVMLARLCLPQVFFYGVFVLLGQVLNARGTFGPMMWAPIANNVISVAMLAAYLVVFGAGDPATESFTLGQELLLGIGSTVGILAQLLVLAPYMRASGYRFRFRLDLRGSGLGHTLRLGSWTVGFVIVNQIAYTVVIRLASSGTAEAATGAESTGTGATVYSFAFLLVMVPHSIATVSLATAMLPRLSRAAAGHDLAAVGRGVSSTMRSAYALVVPFVLLLPLIAPHLANLAWGWGQSAEDYRAGIPTLQLFAIGMFFFTAHYLVLRGFYALEQTRRVFWVQCVIAVVQVGAAVLLTASGPASQTAARLVVAYSLAYAVGAVLSFAVLSREIGGLQAARLVRFGVRVGLAAGIATAVVALVALGLDQVWDGDSKLRAVVLLGSFGLLQLSVFGLLARLMRVEEVTTVLDLLLSRVRRRRRAAA